MAPTNSWISILVVVLLLFFVSPLYGLRVVYPESSFVSTPRHLRIGLQSWPTEYYILKSSSVNVTLGSNAVNEANITIDGIDVHVTKSCWLTNVHKEAEGLTLSSDEVILKFFQEGADAIVIETYIAMIAGSEWKNFDIRVDQALIKNVSVPTMEISRVDVIYLQELIANGTVIVQIGDSDYNPWTDGNLITCLDYVITWCFCLLNIIWATRSLVIFVKTSGCNLNVAYTILVLHILGAMTVALWKLVCLTAEFGLTPYQVGNVLLTLPFPFAILPTMLITAYWNELIRMNRSKPIKFLKKWRRAFYAFSIVIFLACIALSIASNYLGFISLEILAITIFIVTVVLILLYFIVGRRVRAQIEKSPPSASKNRLLQTTRQLTWSAIFLAGFPFAGIALGVQTRDSTAWVRIGNFFVYFFILASGLLQIASFNPRTIEKTISPTTSHTNSQAAISSSSNGFMGSATAVRGSTASLDV